MKDDAFAIEWSDPPAPIRLPGANNPYYAAAADELRQHPKRWAVLKRDASSSLASDIRKGKIAAFRPPGAFDAVGRKGSKPGRTDVYVRFIGDESDVE